MDEITYPLTIEVWELPLENFITHDIPKCTYYVYHYHIYIMPHQWKMNFTVFSALTGLPRSGKSQGNSSLSQRQGKVREFCCKSGNL